MKSKLPSPFGCVRLLIFLSLYVQSLFAGAVVMDGDADKEGKRTESHIAFSVSGTVKDDASQPLPGVNVIIKGTASGTTTDIDGRYNLEVNDENAILVFSFIGYSSQEVPVNNRTVIDITLLPDVQTLGEVVVVGYGVQKKINLTGAVGSVDDEFIKDRPITNVTQALQGAVPGVFVNQNSGQAGSDGATLRIRGIGTLNNTNPLVLVDGIEAPINQVDPNDIASISVLKDAASASIYGSRAANGVLLITTKRGKTETVPSISYNGYAGFTEATRLPDMVTNSAQFMELRNEADINAGVQPSFTQSEIDFYSENGPNTDWVDEFFRRGSIQSHNVSVTGGGARTSFLLSLGNLSQTGITPGERFDRYNVRLNLDTKLGERITIGTSIYLSNGNQKAPAENLVAGDGGDGVIARTIAATPLFPNRTENGELAGLDQSFEVATKNFIHPFVLSELNTYKGIQNQLLASSFAEYEVIKDLKVKGTLAVNYQTSDGESFARQGYFYDWRSGEIIQPAINPNRDRNLSHGRTINLTSWLQANYERSFGEHGIKLLAGFNQESSKYNGFGAGRIKLPSNAVPILNTGNPATATNYENATEWALRSYFARVNYEYKGKYLAEFNIRRDGSSRFGPNNRWGTFPSVSAGWIISNESFMQNNEFLDILKLRASWGQLGNQYAQGTNYPYAAQVALNSNYVFNGEVVAGAAQQTFANPDIKWETTTTANIGLDIGLLERITLESDYFVRTSSDILFALPVPATAGGLEDPVVNTAEVKNKGWELAANYKDKFGAFTLDIGFNVTHVNSKIIKIDDEAAATDDRVIYGNKILKRGAPINSIYGLKAIGIFRDQTEIDASPTQFGNYGPGDLKYADIDNDGDIDDDDRTIIGQEDPSWLYGANISLGFKGFDLSAVISGVSDFQSYGNNEFYEPFFNNNGLGAQWLDRWTPERPTDYPRLYYGSGPNFERTNSFWVLDRSFLRLKNIQLGYSLPASLLERAKIKRMRIYVNGQNLFTRTDFLGFDPERQENQSRGGASYPVLKIVTAGLSVTF